MYTFSITIFLNFNLCFSHNSDVIMRTMASQITSLTIVYPTAYSGEDQRKHQSSASLAFVRGIHRWPVNSPHEGPVTRKCFHLMTSSCPSTEFIFFQKLRNVKIWFWRWVLAVKISCAKKIAANGKVRGGAFDVGTDSTNPYKFSDYSHCFEQLGMAPVKLFPTNLVTLTLCVVVDPLQWRHNERDGVSNHQPHDCLLNRLFKV